MPFRLLILFCLASACWQPVVETTPKPFTVVDDRLTLSGEVCTSPANPRDFAVKVVFVIDKSGSMCVSDPPGSQESGGFCDAHRPPGATTSGRVRALSRLLDRFEHEPNVQVALVPFATNVEEVWPSPPGASRFARPNADLRAQVGALQTQLGKGTDYQGALAQTYALIADDVERTQRNEPAVLPRTRYVVVFVTDGVPYPRCSVDDALTRYADDVHPELTWADTYGATAYCNALDPADPDAIAGFVPGTDRNQNAQLFDAVDRLMELKAQYNVGDLRLHTVLLFNEEAVRACGPECQDLYGRYVRWPGPTLVQDGPAAAHDIARWTLGRLAEHGNGVFQEFVDSAGLERLDLGTLDYSTLGSPNVLKALFVQALSSEAGEGHRVLDTDGDGLEDERDNDFTFHTNRFLADTDGDGFDDAFEVRHRDDGFRPDEKDPRGCDPASPLTPQCLVVDTDGDGLSQYAEAYLGTRPTEIDSDGDGLPDGVEVHSGLDPLTPSAKVDTDGDGRTDAEEVRVGSSPLRPDNAFANEYGYLTTLTERRLSDGSRCYQFTIGNVQLVTPPNREGLRQGFNQFRVWFAEAPEDGSPTDYGVWRAACAWAQYDPPSVRVPAGAELRLTPPDFFSPPVLASNAGHCVGISPGGP